MNINTLIWILIFSSFLIGVFSSFLEKSNFQIIIFYLTAFNFVISAFIFYLLTKEEVEDGSR